MGLVKTEEFQNFHEPHCSICKVDIPCVHQLDKIRLEGYNEGFNYHNLIHDRVEMYANLLHLGDYEKYQPNIFIEPRSLENPVYLIKKLEATIEEYRAYWIQNRLTEYISAEWNKWNEKTMDAFERCILLAKLADSKGLVHPTIPYFRQF